MNIWFILIKYFTSYFNILDRMKISDQILIFLDFFVIYKSLTIAYSFAQDKCIPFKSVNSYAKKRGPKWFTATTKRATRNKYRLHCKLRACSSNLKAQLKKEYNLASKLVKQTVRSSRANFELNLAESCASTKNFKQLYSYINDQKSCKDIIRSLKNNDGVCTSDGQEIVNLLNEQFSNVFNPAENDSLAHLNNRSVKICSLDIKVFSTTNILNIIEKLKVNKSAGSDGIHPMVVSNCAAIFAPILSKIFETSFITGKLPQQWKECNVTPIHKKGDRSEPANYRPISLTAVPCKMMERIVRDVMLDHLTTHNLIVNEQHGFVKAKSCLTNLLETIDIITDSLSNGYLVNIVFLDFAKAFDKVCHMSLLVKLEAYGFDSHIRAWIQDFLHN